MLWCQYTQNVGLSNRKLKSAPVRRMITIRVRFRQTDGRTDRRTNIVAIAQRFVLKHLNCTSYPLMLSLSSVI